MKTIVNLSLHENYVQLKVKLYRENARNYIEYGFGGSNVVNLIRQSKTLETLKNELSSFNDYEDIRPSLTYLDGFVGHFEITYEIIDKNDITKFQVNEARFISEKRGGRNVSGGFKNDTFKDKIFINLLNSVIDKDVPKLNKVMDALYNIGG